MTLKSLIPNYCIVDTPDTVILEDTKELLSKDVIDQASCLTILVNSFKELKADFNNYLLDSYKTLKFTEERLNYIDIAHISRFVV